MEHCLQRGWLMAVARNAKLGLFPRIEESIFRPACNFSRLYIDCVVLRTWLFNSYDQIEIFMPSPARKNSKGFNFSHSHSRCIHTIHQLFLKFQRFTFAWSDFALMIEIYDDIIFAYRQTRYRSCYPSFSCTHSTSNIFCDTPGPFSH